MEKKTNSADDPPSGSVLAQIAELRSLDGNQLRQRWNVLMPGKQPHTYQAVLNRLIHRVQEIAYGELSVATRERLEAIADADENKSNNRMEAPIAGTIYRREWHGEQHEVVSAAEGFEYRGCKYRSLTAIARKITGQHLNGKLFFGVTARNRKGTK